MPKLTAPDFSDHSNQVLAAWIVEHFNALEARVAELEAAKPPAPEAVDKKDAKAETKDSKKA